MDEIGEKVLESIKQKRLTMNKVATSIDGVGIAQVSRIIYGENYTINTLKQVLDFLDLEIKIVPKGSS